MTHATRLIITLTCATLVPAAAPAQYVVENLGRGVIAIRTSENAVYVGWRLLGTDQSDLAFNVYRASGAGAPVRLNPQPITATTNLVDGSADLSLANAYTVRPVLQGTELAASAPFVLAANAPVQQYLTVSLDRPAGGNVEVPAGSPTSAFTYSPNDASVADLDGDGEFEIIVKWEPSNQRDNASAGLSGRQLIDAYKFDGTRLWRIDLGRNIRSGPHYTQFMVYDLDGDGRAEVACKPLMVRSMASARSLATPAKITDRSSSRRTAFRSGHKRSSLWQSSGRARVLHDLRRLDRRSSRDNGLHTRTRSNRRLGRHDPQYRLAVVWQNVAYNQPPHPSFFLGDGMAEPPRPRVVHADTLAPAFKSLTASSTTLWPPNHRMVPVTVTAELVDLLDSAPTARIVSVSSNEPIDGADDGDTSPDWEITGPLSVNLRAERSGTGTGRVYTIQVEGTDAAGNAARQTVSVSVPLAR